MNRIISGKPKETSHWIAFRLADFGDELRQAEGSWTATADNFHRNLHNPSAALAAREATMSFSRQPRQATHHRRARRANEVRQHLKADYILANPPFNMSDWGGDRLRDDPRWKHGAPPVGNANFAWVQHFIHHLAPTGMAGFVLANGSMSSNSSGEGDIRKAMVEADLVDCMVALPMVLNSGYHAAKENSNNGAKPQ